MILTGLFGAAAALAGGFATYLVMRYRRRHSPYYLWWAASFYFYAMTFVTQIATVGYHWTIVWYQIYVIGSASLVGTMSVGTSYLAFPRTWSRRYALVIAVLIAGLVAATLSHAPQLAGGTWRSLNAGFGIVGVTRVMYIILSALGGSVVWVGALWSFWRSRHIYNLLIAGGVMIAGLAGTLASQGLGTIAFPLANIVALLLIFWGYVQARESRSRPASRVDMPS